MLQKIRANQALQNLLIYGFGQGFNLVTPLLVVPFVVSVCSEAGYGKISIAMALSFFLIVFVDYGSDIVGVKQAAVSRHDRDALEGIFVKTFWAKIALFGLVAGVGSLLFVTIPYFAAEKRLFFFSLAIVAGQAINPTWFLQGVEEFKWITAINVISKTLFLVAVFAFVRAPGDYVLHNLFWGVGMCVAHGIATLFLVRRYRCSLANVTWSDVTLLIRGNFSIFTSQLFVSMQMYAPVMLIGFFGGNHMAGQYKIVDQVIVIFKTYILLFFNYAYPRVCYLLESDVRHGLRFWRMYNGLNLVFVTVCMAVIFTFSDAVVGYFNPTDPIAISALLRLAVAIPVLQAIGVPLRQLVIGFNKQKQYVTLTMVSTVASLLMIIAVAPWLHIIGVIATLIATEILIIGLFYAAIKNELFARSG